MEQKGLDFNFFIGMFLIFGLLMWFNINQVPITSTQINAKDTINNISLDKKLIIETPSNKHSDLSLENNYMDDIDTVFYSLSNSLLSLKFSNYGACINEVVLKDYYTYDSLDLKLIKDLDFNFSFFIKDQILNSNQIVFKDVIQEKDKLIFIHQDQHLNTIKFIYELIPNSYNLKFNVITENGNTYIEPNKLLFTQNIHQLEKNFNNERNTTTINYSLNETSSKQMSLMKDSEKTVEKPFWVAHKQQFFSTIISSSNIFREATFSTYTPDSDEYIKRLSSEFKIEYDNLNNNYAFNFYFLPNKYSLLKSFNQGFESLVPLGKFVFGWVNRFLVIPMFNFLDNMGLNYGLIILIIALTIKFLLFLPTKSSYMSMAKMRVLKPEIDAINEKIKDPMQKQQAQMNLYRKTGVNPLGGCLPLLFQMPILIALFRFFPASIELRQQPFLWADDLSTYDSILDLGFNIPLYGDHISLFALLMTGATVLQMMYSNQLSANSQMPQMKYVMYMMPLIFLFVMNNYSAALSYYYFLANLITFAQQAIIRRSIDDEKLYKMLQANKKKPIKKSKFQQKLEEMSRKNQNR
tara:strand:+ start:774 stop:2510 length:1737 start_codon:yes stop_codon:yes gene_type:complete